MVNSAHLARRVRIFASIRRRSDVKPPYGACGIASIMNEPYSAHNPGRIEGRAGMTSGGTGCQDADRSH